MRFPLAIKWAFFQMDMDKPSGTDMDMDIDMDLFALFDY